MKNILNKIPAFRAECDWDQFHSPKNLSSAKNIKTLFNPQSLIKQKKLLDVALLLMEGIGQELFLDFNVFRKKVDGFLKNEKIKLTAPEKNHIWDAVS